MTFYLTSRDVTHGIKLAGTNVNMMALPGQVSTLKATFDEAGTFNYICHEYCGCVAGADWPPYDVWPVDRAAGRWHIRNSPGHGIRRKKPSMSVQAVPGAGVKASNSGPIDRQRSQDC